MAINLVGRLVQVIFESIQTHYCFFDFQLSQADSGASLKELKLYPQETLTLEEKWVSHRDTAVVLDILSSVFSVTATAAAIPTVFFMLARPEGNGRSNWISFQAMK